MKEIKALFQDEVITLLYDSSKDLFYDPSNLDRPYDAYELEMMQVVLPLSY